MPLCRIVQVGEYSLIVNSDHNNVTYKRKRDLGSLKWYTVTNKIIGNEYSVFYLNENISDVFHEGDLCAAAYWTSENELEFKVALVKRKNGRINL